MTQKTYEHLKEENKSKKDEVAELKELLKKKDEEILALKKELIGPPKGLNQ